MKTRFICVARFIFAGKKGIRKSLTGTSHHTVTVHNETSSQVR